MATPASKVEVRLSDEQRAALDRLVRTGTHPAARPPARRHPAQGRRRRPGRLDRRRGSPRPSEVSRITVARVRQRFVAEGLDAALHRKKPTGRQYRKLDGAQEARLIALACSHAARRPGPLDDAAAGRQAGRAGGRRVDRPGDGPADASKNELKPWLKEQWVIPPKASAEFVAGDGGRAGGLPPAATTRTGRWSAWTRAASS